MSDVSQEIYTAAADDVDRLIAELTEAKGNLDWAAVRAKAEAIAVLAPLADLALSYNSEDA